MKKKLLVLILSLAMIASFTACGLGNSDDSTDENTEQNQTNEDVTVGLEKNVYQIPDYSNVDSDVKVLRVAMSLTEADYGVSAPGAMAKTFVDKLEELSGGKLVAQVYPGNQLASTTDDIINGLSTGAFEMSETSVGSWGDYTNAYAAMNVPFLFKDDQSCYEAMNGEIGDTMNAQLYEDTKMHVVGFMYLGMRTLSNNSKEVRTVDDMKGLKLRVQADPIQMATFEALGASTMTVPFSELFTALQQGMCDGQDNAVTTFVSKKFYEVQSNLTLLNHMPNISVFYVGDQCWSQLTDEEKSWIEEAGAAASEASFEACMDSLDILISQLKEYGINVVELTDEERQGFIDAVSGDVWDQCKDLMSDDLWNAIMEYAE